MTKIATQKRIFRPAFVWTAFALLTVSIYLFGLDIPLLGPDEPRYAQVAREMFERGDWITPTLGGHHWFEKPALLYWLQIGSYNIFGVTEFAARFGSALFGLGTVAALWILGRSVSERAEFANWLAVLAATTIGIIVFSRGASFDIVLTFPITAALVCFYIFDVRTDGAERRGAPWPLAGFYFFIGVSLLAKGLVGIVFPFAIVGLYHVLARRLPSKHLLISLAWGMAIAAAVAALWYLPMYLRHGWEFIDEFFIQHHFQRYTSNKYFHPQPFHFFFWVLPLMTIPWLPFFFAGLWQAVRNFFRPSGSEAAGPAERSENRLALFALCWLLVPLAFFSLSGSKLPGYILPAVPAAIVISAIAVSRWIGNSDVRKFVIQLIAFATFLIVAALLQFVVPQFAYKDSVKGLIEAADARGMTSERVLMLHTVSHNAEFYAAGRIERGADGKQKIFYGAHEVLENMRQHGGQPVLVIVPLEYLRDVEQTPLVAGDLLADNGELAIAHVRER